MRPYACSSSSSGSVGRGVTLVVVHLLLHGLPCCMVLYLPRNLLYVHSLLVLLLLDILGDLVHARLLLLREHAHLLKLGSVPAIIIYVYTHT